MLLGVASAAAQPVEGPERRVFRVGNRSFDLSAASITYEREGDLYVARGEVQIAQEGRVLTADWIAFSSETLRGLAVGNVIARE